MSTMFPEDTDTAEEKMSKMMGCFETAVVLAAIMLILVAWAAARRFL